MDFKRELNDKQYEACVHTDGPLLIIAGAGSGKTRVITHRIAYLMQEKHVAPWNIMAITFTNKAANEMRERVDAIAGFGAEAVWVSTFHSSCARILRRYIDRIGYTSAFSIYDTEDSKTLIKNIVAEMNLDPKVYVPKSIQFAISSAKNSMTTVEDMEKEASTKVEEVYAAVYRKYQASLFANNALDFDDLLIKTVELFEKDAEVLDSYQERFKYIMVDEYQDTNGIQFRLIELLSAKYRNLCVVGDDDQSIYKFRGADIRNILDFEKKFSDAKVVRLEQNYRSVANILNAANSVIKNNSQRKEKTLWTSKFDGDKVIVREYENAFEEARGVVAEIGRKAVGETYNAFAILYRTNAQSRLFEEQLVRSNIPYRLVGGVNFYSRKEIKDVLAYLKAIENGNDEISVRRIINVPKRGIGDRSIERLSEYANENGISFFEACCRIGEIETLRKASSKIDAFAMLIRRFRTYAKEYTVPELVEKLLDETGYLAELKSDKSQEAQDRIDNLDEFISKAEAYNKDAEEPSLSGFLQEVSLVADIDSLDEDQDRVLLMTVHSSKGLEFDNVYLAGLEDGLFPGYGAVSAADDAEMEEERRLFYVGMTRARNTLAITYAKSRMKRGEVEFCKVSRFIGEIDPDYAEFDTAKPARSFFSDDRYSERYSRGGDNAGAYSGSTRGGSSYSSGNSYGSSYSQRSSCGSSYSGGYESSRPRSAAKQSNYFDPGLFKVKKADSLAYSVGDKVKHKKFGVGTVMDIKDGGKDYEVTVEFETAGSKRMFAAFAKLEVL